MTAVFCCGFECGVSGAHWTLGATASFNTNSSFIRSGARSLRFNPSAVTTGTATSVPAFSSNKIVSRFYIYFSSLPIANWFVLDITVSSRRIGVIFQQSDSTLNIQLTHSVDSNQSGPGFVVTTGQWYRIDYEGDISTNTWSQRLSVNGTEVTASNLISADTATTVVLGSAITSTCDIYMDDFVLSNTIADYPIGDGYVNHFVPTSDGTHTSTSTNIREGTIASPSGTAITSATTDAFNWVNAVPILGGATDNTRLQNANATASTQYTEEIYGPAPGISTPTTAPRAVEALVAYRQGGTGTGVSSFKLNDNGTEAVIVSLSGAGVTTDRYTTKQFSTPPTGGAWTVVSGNGNFNNIRHRFGYSSDANPTQFFRGTMIEAEFATPIPNKIIQIIQSINRASTF
jgi:hypothetical protein